VGEIKDDRSGDRQRYLPAEIELERRMQAPEIAVYVNRRSILVDTFKFTALEFLCFLPMINLIVKGDPIFHAEKVFIVILILMTVLIILEVRYRLRFFFMRDPLLIVNCEGITIGRHHSFRSGFIPWWEIESLYVYTAYRRTDFRIRLRDHNQLVQRLTASGNLTVQGHIAVFSGRIFRRRSDWLGEPSLSVPQMYMNISADEMLQRIDTDFWVKLRIYQINVYPSNSAVQQR
jgi:hypothetical protein